MNHSRTFAVVLRPEPEGGFTVRVVGLPEIVTYGENEAEALAMAEDAIQLAIESRTERGEELPSADPPLIRQVTVTIAA